MAARFATVTEKKLVKWTKGLLKSTCLVNTKTTISWIELEVTSELDIYLTS